MVDNKIKIFGFMSIVISAAFAENKMSILGKMHSHNPHLCVWLSFAGAPNGPQNRADDRAA